MAQAYAEDSVLVEIHIATGAKPVIEPFSDAYQELIRTTVLEFNGRLHWAKNSTPYFVEQPATNFPMWDSFLDLKNEFDPQGMFESKLWQEMKANSELSPFDPFCGVDRSCFCEVDEPVNTCGRAGVCVPGSLNPEIGVCERKSWF